MSTITGRQDAVLVNVCAANNATALACSKYRSAEALAEDRRARLAMATPAHSTQETQAVHQTLYLVPSTKIYQVCGMTHP